MRYRLYQRRTKGKNWFVRFTCRGKQYRVSTKTDIRADAEVMADRIYERAWSSITGFPGLKLSKVIDVYMRYLQGRDAVMATMRTHEEVWKKALGDRIAAEVSTMAVHGVLDTMSDAKEWKPATYNRYLAFIKAVYNHAIHMDLLNANPAAKIKKRKETPRDVFLKPAQVEHILGRYRSASWADPYYGRSVHAAFLLAVSTGIRANELLTLCWEDVDAMHGTITIKAANTKTLKKRTIPVPGSVLKLMADITKNHAVLPTDRIFYYIQYRALRNEAKAISLWLGMEVKWHDLRHTFAVKARRNGMDMMTLMKVLGHADIASTQRYAEFGDDTEYLCKFMPDFTDKGAK
jgi:integrase